METQEGDLVRLVMKFGGTSVAGAARMGNAAALAAREARQGHQVVVVTSAMAGTTDGLLGAAERAAAGDLPAALREVERLARRHRRTLQELSLPEGEVRELAAHLRRGVGEVRAFLRSLAVLGELTPRARDALVSWGERWAAPLLAAALRREGVPARAVVATEVVVTDGRHGGATPDPEATRVRARRILEPLLAAGTVPVVTGYLGATPEGRITTLGRGGSDYSATLLGAALEADEVWIWTDVPGVMTADPRIVPEARTLPRLSYAEAAELAYFGAKVLHPRTLLPVLEPGIPVRVRSTFQPQGPDTLLVPHVDPPPHGVRAVTLVREVALVTVAGRGMLGVPGVAARVFAAVARAGVNVLMISQASSEQSICFVVRHGDAPRAREEVAAELALELARRDVDRIEVEGPASILTAVGGGMRRTPGVAARLFGALAEGGINVLSIAQGSSPHALSCVVAAEDGEEGVRRIHRAFRLDRLS